MAGHEDTEICATESVSAGNGNFHEVERSGSDILELVISADGEMRGRASDKADSQRLFFNLITGSEGHGASREEGGVKQREKNGGACAIRGGGKQSVEILPSERARV